MRKEDPGWRPALKGALLRVLLPHLAIRGKAKGKPAILALRSLWISALLSWALFGGVLSFLEPETDRSSWVLPAVIGMGTLSLLEIAWVRSRPLKTENSDALAGSYVQLSVIGFAFANAAVLFGFVGFFVGGGRMPAYVAAIPFGLAGFVGMAPTAANIARFQRRIRDAGSSLSLMESLRTPFSPPSRAPSRRRKPPSEPTPPPVPPPSS